jgi:Rab9 effector protein with kelch motifs
VLCVPPLPLSLRVETFFWYKPNVTGDIPGPRKAHSTSLVNNCLYVFGGGDAENYFEDLYVLDVITHHWTKPETKGDVPGPRRAHTATVVGNKIWIFGGGDGKAPLDATYALDTENMTWAELKSNADALFPDARGYHSACMVDTKIAYFGGSDMEECFSDMVVLDTGLLAVRAGV